MQGLAIEGQGLAGLPPAIDAPIRIIEGGWGDIALYVDGAGPPVLLIHSVNAAASSYEMRTIFEHLRQTRRVFAMDLPGFGLSERDAGPYHVERFVEAIAEVAWEVLRISRARTLDVVALSLSAEFVARAALAEDEIFGRLAFITPTGFQTGAHKLRGPLGGDRAVPGLERGLTLPFLSDALYAGLVSRPSIRFFLNRTFGGAKAPDDMVDYAWRTAHQPGAKHAVLAFASGKLFSSDIRSVYEGIKQPVWLAHGMRGPFADFAEAGWVHQRVNWTKSAFDTGAMPHIERSQEFLPALSAFLDDASPGREENGPGEEAARQPDEAAEAQRG